MKPILTLEKLLSARKILKHGKEVGNFDLLKK